MREHLLIRVAIFGFLYMAKAFGHSHEDIADPVATKSDVVLSSQLPSTSLYMLACGRDSTCQSFIGFRFNPMPSCTNIPGSSSSYLYTCNSVNRIASVNQYTQPNCVGAIASTSPIDPSISADSNTSPATYSKGTYCTTDVATLLSSVGATYIDGVSFEGVTNCQTVSQSFSAYIPSVYCDITSGTIDGVPVTGSTAVSCNGGVVSRISHSDLKCSVATGIEYFNSPTCTSSGANSYESSACKALSSQVLAAPVPSLGTMLAPKALYSQIPTAAKGKTFVRVVSCDTGVFSSAKTLILTGTCTKSSDGTFGYVAISGSQVTYKVGPACDKWVTTYELKLGVCSAIDSSKFVVELVDDLLTEMNRYTSKPVEIVSSPDGSQIYAATIFDADCGLSNGGTSPNGGPLYVTYQCINGNPIEKDFSAVNCPASSLYYSKVVQIYDSSGNDIPMTCLSSSLSYKSSPQSSAASTDNTALIAGVVGGGVVFLCLVGAGLFYFCYFTRGQSEFGKEGTKGGHSVQSANYEYEMPPSPAESYDKRKRRNNRNYDPEELEYDIYDRPAAATNSRYINSSPQSADRREQSPSYAGSGYSRNVDPRMQRSIANDGSSYGSPGTRNQRSYYERNARNYHPRRQRSPI